MSIRSHLLSALSLAVITLNLVLWCVPLIVLAGMKALFPFLRRSCDAAMDWIYRAAVVVDDAWLRSVVGIEWDQPDLGLRRDESVLVISNHASWADIFMIQSVIARRGPALKFLAKRELIYVPILGLILWAFEFPLLRRRAAEGEGEGARRAADLTAIREACRSVRHRPAGLLNFAEGTRFTEAKRAAGSGEYAYLLPPRVGGFAALLDGLEGAAERVIDLTLIYTEPVSFWAFLGGASPRVRLEASWVAADEIPPDRSGRATWLAERWQRKEHLIEAARR